MFNYLAAYLEWRAGVIREYGSLDAFPDTFTIKHHMQRMWEFKNDMLQTRAVMSPEHHAMWDDVIGPDLEAIEEAHTELLAWFVGKEVCA